MENRESGIVLRPFTPSAHKFCVLTQRYGKITLVVLNAQSARCLRQGAIISFLISEKNDSFYTTDRAEIIFIPLPQENHDLYWLHHLLEVCYFFLPMHEPIEEYFIVVSNGIYWMHNHNFTWAQWQVIKKVNIVVLMSLLGFAPPLHLQPSARIIHKTLLWFIDFQKGQKVEFLSQHHDVFAAVSVDHLDVWLLECLQSHPRATVFKTLPFVYNKS